MKPLIIIAVIITIVACVGIMPVIRYYQLVTFIKNGYKNIYTNYLILPAGFTVYLGMAVCLAGLFTNLFFYDGTKNYLSNGIPFLTAGLCIIMTAILYGILAFAYREQVKRYNRKVLSKATGYSYQEICKMKSEEREKLVEESIKKCEEKECEYNNTEK